MPFKSKKQRAWMYEKHPAMAREWELHTPKSAKIPTRVKLKKKRGY